jgi:hypothetical protein
LDGRDEGETLRSLARLRNALLSRSGLGAPTIEEICRAIQAIWTSARAWDRPGSSERTATLKYSLTEPCLSLTVDDESGWLLSRCQLEGGPTGGLVDGALFDDIVADPAARSLQMVKRFPPRS